MHSISSLSLYMCAFLVMSYTISSAMLHLNLILRCLESNEATTLTTLMHLKINLLVPPKFTLYVVEQTY